MAKKIKTTKAPKKRKKATSLDDYDNLFNFIKVFFGNNPRYKNVTNYQKQKHRFMMQRFFAIRYPTSANAFNIIGTNPAAVTQVWHGVARKFTKTPKWIYTKTKAKAKVKNKDFIPSEETVQFYLQRNMMSSRDYQTAMKFAKEDLLKELQTIENARKDD